jgi:putative membrane protein insertion efficiency factor
MKNLIEPLKKSLKKQSFNLLDFLFAIYGVLLRPVFGHSCAFQPTCSEYSRQVLKTQGLLKGSLLSLLRICRCHPFTKGGMDPVPGCCEVKNE